LRGAGGETPKLHRLTLLRNTATGAAQKSTCQRVGYEMQQQLFSIFHIRSGVDSLLILLIHFFLKLQQLTALLTGDKLADEVIQRKLVACPTPRTNQVDRHLLSWI